MRELNPLERDVIAEVRRSLKVEETSLFAQAIMMMRPMDDEVSPTLLLYFIILQHNFTQFTRNIIIHTNILNMLDSDESFH